MHTRTEDLLSIRDGEPIGSADRDRVLSDPAARAELERLRHVANRLAELPELDPPADGWSRVSDVLDRRARRGRLGRRLGLAGAIAAGLAAVAVVVLVGTPGPADVGPARFATDGTAAPAPERATDTAAYSDLIRESARLEHVLAELPKPPRVMRLGTAGTIVDLEDQISLIDQQLTYGGERLAPEYRQTLWRNRVDVMDALVQIRYVQAQRIDY